MKTFKTFLTSIAMLLCCVSVSAHDFEVNGICYNITSSTTKTVEVTYRGNDYDNWQDPSTKYSGSITIPQAVIYKGNNYNVTSIGERAFYKCVDLLTSITIPNSVTSIGEDAFYRCSGLTSIIIEKGNKHYDSRENCNAIIETSTNTLITGCKNTIIPNSVTSIGHDAFYECSELTSITIPNSVTSIEYGAFYDCSGLTSITISNGVTSIGRYAFEGCSGLTSITIPNSVTSIEYDTFRDCSGLMSIIIEKGNKHYDSRENCNAIIETSTNTLITGCKNTIIPNSVTSIECCAFENCSGLTSITIPNSVTSIDYNAFTGCSGLETLTIECKEINKYTFGNFISLQEIRIGNKVTSIGNGNFTNCPNLTSIIVEKGNEYFDSRENCNAIIKTSTNTLIKGCKSTIIPNSVTSIGNWAFMACSGLTSITIPNSVTSIDNGAFMACSELTSITIPNSVTSIGAGAFYDCSELTSITIPNSVTSIGDEAFRYCRSLKTMIIGSGVLSIGQDQCSPLKTIWLTNTLPSGYYHLEGNINYLANKHYGLDNVNVYPYLSSIFEVDGVIYVPVNPSERTCDAIDCSYDTTFVDLSIGETVMYKGVTMTVQNVMPYTAYGQESVKTLTLLNIGSIGEKAFYGCSGITEAIIANEGSIGTSAFYNCSSLAALTLGDNISSIGANAFEGCSNLTKIEIPNKTTVLNEYCFTGCTKLTEVGFGTGIKTIGKHCFSGCAIQSISIPENVTSIGDYTFYNCKKLSEVIIEDRTTGLSLGSNGSSPLFADCPLNSVYIGGNISYQTSSSYGYSPFYRNTSLRSVIITDKEDNIPDNAFYGCTNLKKVSIGDNVERIGRWAFSGCSNLDYFLLGRNVKSIGQEAFSDCVNMTKLISYATTPPTCETQALDDINKWSCKLLVPSESISTYQAATQWKDFFFIEDVLSSINSVTTDNSMPTKADVYNCDGVLVKRNVIVKDLQNELPTGIYIIDGKKIYIK